MWPKTKWTLVVFLLVACGPTSGQEDSPPPEPTDNPILRALFEADQTDRTPESGVIDWERVVANDSSRRAQVLAMLDSNLIITSADFYHASMVFQHGSDTVAGRRAYDLARRAVDIDSTNSDAKWLMAAAWDRYQMRRGDPQWYGTQFVKDTPESQWRLYDVDTTAVTDAERILLGVPTLAESRVRVAEMNRRRP